ncbi:chromosome condensation [Fusarium albosuccineum]|uniref:Chromosome condensation n=1 Tax=Fusarium albosuccineum TaxID=1237068 RepID=A0A8H4P436_9HYPO|nr:chromosome condensation [Fusarium albosuccineum]
MVADSPERTQRRSSSGVYNSPGSYVELGEILAQQPIEEDAVSDTETPSPTAAPASSQRRDSGVYNVPRSYSNLDEVSPVPPIEEPPLDSAQDVQGRPRRRSSFARHETPTEESDPIPQEASERRVSRLATELYTHSYMILFAILGTLARLGLTALTRYSDTPVIFNTVWCNFTGSMIMGFLAEDRKLFRNEWANSTYDDAIQRAKQKRKEEEEGSGSSQQTDVDLEAAKRAHLATKKTIPLYIGLATGFCGSFTTFSSFIKDVFLALSNEMPTPGWSDSPTSRNGGYSFMAMLAVIITTVSLSLSGLFIGAHLAIGLERITPTIPFSLSRRVLDPLGVFLGWGCWLAAVLLAIFPPHKTWRGQALFSLVFAPLGCLLRFYLSLHLNGKMATFPVGTFAANVLGTVLLGMSWDLAHVPLGGVVGCQVLQGIEDGFCGCLTTISTWVAELSSLRRRSSWIYGTTSVVVSLVLMIAIMGGLRWSDGYNKLLCTA